MRHYLKSFLITIAAFYVAYNFMGAINLGIDPKNIILVVGGLWIISQIINPVFSLVLLPVNLLTFGLIALVLNIAFFFALINFLPGFTITEYSFPGANLDGVILPPMAFNQVATIILVATSITFLQKLLHIIFE